MTGSNRLDRMLGMGMLAALAVGCLFVLTPFVTALLMAVILTFSTWPLYLRLRKSVGGRGNLAAALMTLAACLILIAPFVFVAFSLADNAWDLVDAWRKLFEHGLPALPQWMTDLPLVGETLKNYWKNLSQDSSRVLEDLQSLISPARSVLVTGGGILVAGLLQLGLAVLVAFFLYRDGQAAAAKIQRITSRTRRVACDHPQKSDVRPVCLGVLTPLGSP